MAQHVAAIGDLEREIDMLLAERPSTASVRRRSRGGVIACTPIRPLGTSTIVGFGQARPVAHLRNSNAFQDPTITVSATFDHRLIDGGHSGRLLQQLKDHPEVPALGLLS